MAENKNVPRVRFSGFNDAWEERKLGDAVNISSGVTGDATLQDGEYRLTRIESISQGMLNVARLGFTNEKPDQKYLLNLGDILYSNINSLSHIGKVALVDTAGIYHGINLLRFQMRNDVDSEFLFQRLNTMPMKSWAVSHANPAVSQASINQTELSKQPISSPTITEQQKIGSFFKQLDDTIALHQRKLDSLKSVKKALMQKIFDQTWRFEGFNDPWEQHKLSDGTNKIGDGLHGTPKYSEDGDVYFVNGNNLVNGQIVITSETKRVTSNEQSKDDKALNENTILMSINGTIGNLAWYRGENLMLGKSAAYIEVSDFDKKFIYTYLQTRPVKDYYLNSLTGTTIKNLGLKAIRNTNICTPTIDEQAKIGVLFQNLDMTITLHQLKIEKLNEIKKWLMQSMFV